MHVLSYWDLTGYGCEALGGMSFEPLGPGWYRLEPSGPCGRRSEALGGTGVRGTSLWNLGGTGFEPLGPWECIWDLMGYGSEAFCGYEL